MNVRIRLPRSPWDWFPWAIWISLLVVIVINAGMIWAALSTFPGSAGVDGFDASNNYNQVLAAEARAQALGWHIALRLRDGARPVLDLTGAHGRAVADATVSAEAERPVGPPDRRVLVWREMAPGRFVATAALPRGVWDMRLILRAGGHAVTARRTLIAEERRAP